MVVEREGQEMVIEEEPIVTATVSVTLRRSVVLALGSVSTTHECSIVHFQAQNERQHTADEPIGDEYDLKKKRMLNFV